MDINSVFEKFAGQKVLVIGDVMIDAYVEGSVTRVSPEAPVPIVNLGNEYQRLGGAANVALNLLSLGAEPILSSVVGADSAGDTLISLMEKRGLNASGIERSESRKTTVKTRVVGNGQQLLRIDDELVKPLTAQEESQIISNISERIGEIDAIIFEDYNKGVLTIRVIESVINIANKNGVVTAVDPKKDNFFEYKNVTLFKPNLKELKEGLNRQFSYESNPEAFESALSDLESRLNNKISFVTLSEHGVYIRSNSEKHHIPAHIRNISDVSGAGDTVISVATLCLSSGLPIAEVARISNLAGGLVCEQQGVVPIDKELFKSELEKFVEI